MGEVQLTDLRRAHCGTEKQGDDRSIPRIVHVRVAALNAQKQVGNLFRRIDFLIHFFCLHFFFIVILDAVQHGGRIATNDAGSVHKLEKLLEHDDVVVSR